MSTVIDRARGAITFGLVTGALLAVTAGVGWGGSGGVVGSRNIPAAAAATTAGSADVGTTAYTPPAGAVYVSPQGTDSAAGSIGAPFRTLAHAIAVAPASSTIVLRAGTYHESVTIPSNKPLTIQSYPHESAWLNGASVVTGWVQSGKTWVHTGWTAQFDSTPGYTAGSASSGSYFTFVNSSYPMAAHPDQVWIGSHPLAQVGSASAVTAGTFFADYANKRLVIGDDPSGSVMRASTLGVALTSYAADTVVRGIGFQRYATSIPDLGTVRLEGSRDVLENVVSTQNATTGATVDAAGVVMRQVSLTDNGMLGLHGNHADGVTISGLLATGNNTEHFNTAPAAGGAKFSQSRTLTVLGSNLSDNLGTGLWFDESCYNVLVTGDTVSGNAGHGMSLEISAVGIVANNRFQDNAQDGLKINDADHVQVWANTLTGNQREIEVVQDARRGSNSKDPGHDPRRPQPDPTEPWLIEQVTLADNFIGTPATNDYTLYIRDYSNSRSAASYGVKVDANRFVHPTSGAEFVWQATAGSIALYRTPSAFTAASGQGGRNSEQAVASAAPGSGTSPLPLPDAVADAIGVARGTAHTGAF